VLGEPGTGKSVLKQALLKPRSQTDDYPRRQTVPSTPITTLRILCSRHSKSSSRGMTTACERLLVQEAFRIHGPDRCWFPSLMTPHLMPADCLRKLRLLCEDFPRSHNLVLIGQPPLLQSLSLIVNEEIRSRVHLLGRAAAFGA